MEAAALALEQWDAVRALRSSFYAYPIVSALHVLGIGVLLTGVLLMDLRVLGAFAALPAEPFVTLLRRLTLAGFGLAVFTGLTLFSVRAADYVALPLFWVKMGLIVAAGLNLAALLWVGRAKRLFGALSLLLWLGVLFAGRFLGFVYAA
jgi:hypothetical protein